MAQDTKNSRFRVYKFEGVILVNGSINDTTKFSTLDEMVSENELTIDCQKLDSASWLGLSNFCKYLSGLNKVVTFQNIPASIYKYFKLLPDLSSNIKVKSMGVEIIQPGALLARMVEESFIESLFKAQGQLLKMDEGYLFGFAAHNTRSIKLDPDKLDKDFKHQFCQQNPDETQFFFCYLFFVAATVGLAADIVRSVDLSLSQLLSNIITRMENAYEGVLVVVKDIKSDKVQKLKELLDLSRSHCDKEAQDIEKVHEGLERAIGKFQMLMLDAQGTRKQDIYQVIEEVKETMIGCVKLSEAMEDIGSTIGMGILSLTSFDELKKYINAIESNSMSEDNLSIIRDKFNIMDPMSADSWDDTKVEIIAELDHIDSDISRCTVVLQGFDLTRQVLEHRIAESQKVGTLLPQLVSASIHWMEIKTALSTMIADKLVTEQEKAAYAFYLPEGFEAYKSTTTRKNPGDVLLF